MRDAIELPENVVHRHRLEVRVTDLNYGRHLGHVELVGLLHEARVGMLAKFGAEELDVDGTMLMVVELVVIYRAEAQLGQQLVVEMDAVGTGSRGAEIRYRVADAATDRTIAMARTGLLFRDLATGKLAPLPPTMHRIVDGSD
jgi:acyl-CoA thioesterase FadM